GRSRTPSRVERSPEVSILPPPVTLYGGGRKPPPQAPPGAGATSQGLKSTFGLTLSPAPGPTGPGPLEEPHQLQVASRIPFWPLLTPRSKFPVMLLRVMWISFPTFQESGSRSRVLTPSQTLEIILLI